MIYYNRDLLWELLGFLLVHIIGLSDNAIKIYSINIIIIIMNVLFIKSY